MLTGRRTNRIEGYSSGPRASLVTTLATQDTFTSEHSHQTNTGNSLS